MTMRDQWYWRAFHELNTDRPITMGGVGPIPFSSMRGYADEYALDGKERDVFFKVMRALDTKMLTAQLKRNAKE